MDDKKRQDQNALQIIGRLADDCENRTTKSGKLVCNFRLLTNVGVDAVCVQIDCEWWGDRSRVAEYLTRGRQLTVFGHLVGLSTFERRDGTLGASIKANVDRVQLGPAPDRQGGRRKDDGDRQPSEPGYAPAPEMGGDLDDDEVPF